VNRTEKAAFVLERLRTVIERPDTELKYDNRFQLLVVVILSAQCTDERINKISPALFEAFPNARSMAAAGEEEIKEYIKSVTYPNSKAGYLSGAAEKIVEEFGGEVPDTMEELMELPGVGRKTAQVVSAVGFAQDALPVDTHVFRVTNRIGLVKNNATTPLAVEKQLKRIIPRSSWSEAHHLFILHGRYTCTARNPACEECVVSEVCEYYARLQRLPDPIEDLDVSAGAYFCNTCDRYFDSPATHVDRHDQEQVACSSCGSMQVFHTKTGETTKKVPDYRVNG
jgi:endonuclease-3